MRIVKIFILISAIFFLHIPTVLAASTSVSYTFDSSEYYQGRSGSVDVWVTNNGQEYILLEKYWITFDWLSGTGYNIDKSSTPIRIDAGSKVYIGKISFGIESSTSIGYHTYQFSISGQEDKKDFWGNPYLSPFNTGWFGSEQIYIETPLKPEADTALSNALNDINTARSKNFESTDALNKINQATTDYNSGINARNGRDFATAINYANSAKKLISESYPIEQTYQTNKANTLTAKNNAINTINNIPPLQSVDAKNKLDEANSHFTIGETYLSSKNFNSAISEYNTAKLLAEQASNLEKEYQVKKEAELKARQDAELKTKQESEQIARQETEAKQNAENAITNAKSKINSIVNLQSEQGKNMLNDARSHLNTAENHLSIRNFNAAMNEAKIAADYADNSLGTDEKWKNENPIQSAAKAPGFQHIFTIIGIILVYTLSKRRV